MSMTDRCERFTLNYNLEIIISAIFIHTTFTVKNVEWVCLEIKKVVKFTFITVLGWCLLWFIGLSTILTLIIDC